MSEQWTSEQVRRVARDFPFTSLAFRALDSFAAKLEREEEENRRDPLTDPRPGDRIEWVNDGEKYTLVCLCFKTHPNEGWKERARGILSRFESATIILRREVQ